MIYTHVKDTDYVRIISVLVEVIQFDNYEEVFNKIKISISENSNLIALDLTRVKFMDSLSLGMLVPLLLYARRLGGDMAIVALDPRVKELFHLLRLDKVMDVHGDMESAINSLREKMIFDVDDI